MKHQHKNFKDLWQDLKLPILIIVFTFLLGALGYKGFFPQATWTRIFFMTAITLTTVGYGDVLGVENNLMASWYTMLLMLIGMGAVLYSISTVTAFLVEGTLSDLLRTRRMQRRLKKMKDHYIICGLGNTGIHVVREMATAEVPFVVIETRPEVKSNIYKEFPHLLFIHGDATQDKVLQQANIESAKGLVAALSNDKDNLYLTFSARLLNPKLQIVCKAVDIELIERLKKAGANYIVSPNFIGGMRIASEILRPHVVTFLDRMLRGKNPQSRVSEVVISTNSPHLNRSFASLNVYQNTGLNLLGYSPTGKDEDFIYNPPLETLLQAGGVVLFIGNSDQQRQFEALLNNGKD